MCDSCNVKRISLLDESRGRISYRCTGKVFLSGTCASFVGIKAKGQGIQNVGGAIQRYVLLDGTYEYIYFGNFLAVCTLLDERHIRSVSDNILIAVINNILNTVLRNILIAVLSNIFCPYYVLTLLCAYYIIKEITF